MKNPILVNVRHVLLALLSMMLLFVMFWLVSTQDGKKIQLNLFGSSYLPTDATVTETFVYIDPPRATNGKSGDGMYEGAVILYMYADYTVEDEKYSEEFVVKEWPWRAVKDSIMTKEADAFKDSYLQVGDHTTIYYYPKNPADSLLYQEDEPHFWFIFLIFLPTITLLVIFIFYHLGGIYYSDYK